MLRARSGRARSFSQVRAHGRDRSRTRWSRFGHEDAHSAPRPPFNGLPKRPARLAESASEPFEPFGLGLLERIEELAEATHHAPCEARTVPAIALRAPSCEVRDPPIDLESVCRFECWRRFPYRAVVDGEYVFALRRCLPEEFIECADVYKARLKNRVPEKPIIRWRHTVGAKRHLNELIADVVAGYPLKFAVGKWTGQVGAHMRSDRLSRTRLVVRCLR
jgi:hypothetical protein